MFNYVSSHYNKQCGTTHLRPYLYAAYLFGSSTEEDDEEVAKAKATAWEIGGGAAIFLNDFASIDITLGYGKATFISRDDEKAKILAKALAVNVGFSLYF
ncbi:hypothetical protein [Carboxylicivirga marina]|uniref:Outer membrane protein beta-barrel domain-containing protein n=1 Tax=Carboxylicivirga marina TaxID=2800988 RepID=A0ABS1HLD1_9BACT|nr:hypothetical protein [Carboxylicivirga marina]MBK3517954.1 hypothetical protein [Carboxylicivirga marina]